MWIVHHPNLRAKATHTPSPNAAHGAHQSQGTSTMRHQAAPPTTRQLTSPLLVTVLYEIEHDDRVTTDEEERMAPPRCIHIHPLPSTTNHTPAPVIVMRTSQATAGRVVSHKSDTRIQLIHATLKHSKPTNKPRTYSRLQKQHRNARLVERRTVKPSSMSSVSQHHDDHAPDRKR